MAIKMLISNAGRLKRNPSVGNYFEIRHAHFTFNFGGREHDRALVPATLCRTTNGIFHHGHLKTQNRQFVRKLKAVSCHRTLKALRDILFSC
jgi:hypothetical protein